MIRFRDRVFGRDGDQWYVWEPHWDSMRPIDAFAWNGRTYVIVDDTFTANPFEESFGYGELRERAQQLTDLWVGDIDSAPTVQHALIGKPVWWKDHWAVRTEDAPPESWRKHHQLLKTRPRTCRRMPRGKRSTKRVLPRDKSCA